jgi:hypothetical protein
MQMEKFYICVDFDGTCVTHSYPYIGKEIGSEPILKRLTDAGHRLILFTMRSKTQLDEAVAWFSENNIPLFGVQTNPTQSAWTSSPKAYGHLYIDDSALGCPLSSNPIYHDKPFVDWVKVEELLIEKQILPKNV